MRVACPGLGRLRFLPVEPLPVAAPGRWTSPGVNPDLYLKCRLFFLFYLRVRICAKALRLSASRGLLLFFKASLLRAALANRRRLRWEERARKN